MTAFVIPLAVFLAVVFAASAIGKLRSPDRGRAAFSALQIPVRRPDAAAIALIVAEALVALGLVATWGWVFVVFAAAAVVLTAGLLVVVVRAHRRGATDDCGCFGDWLPAAIGPRLITRNVMLALAAVGVLVTSVLIVTLTDEPLGVPLVLSSPVHAGDALGALAASALISAAAWSTARATTSVAAAQSAARGAGAVLLPETSEIADLLAPGTRARLLLFVSAGCHACETALAPLRNPEDDISTLVDVFVVQRAASGSSATRSAHELPRDARFALDIGGSLGASLGTGPATPVAALIGTDGIQAGPLAIGSDETTQLVESLRSLAAAPPA
ncbi:MauE/DoxX family redox-associated membrane protein [Microbacterium sp. EST19A]|uniref:MauE/DoxX family redox-associated membrane protein n=1 Tax=Microbacterium sp. EST19A TaxID=2862681 RepID=UPI001CC17544|nr:MauE/DoxX family redox-associated membrane protein [Microbacterium sp. EST19A]